MQKNTVDIEFREYQKGDAPYLEDIIRRTWQYDRFCSPKTAGKMAKLYLESCLSRQTFTRVALIKGKPAGIIMGKDRRSGRDRRIGIRLLRAEAAMLFDREGRRVLNAFSSIDDLDRELLEGRNKSYEGELTFFAVSEDCRGTGIGKKLFRMFQEYMKGRGITGFYLYTDSSCNYGFYEHQGMVR